MKRLMAILTVQVLVVLGIVVGPAFSATESGVTATVSTGTLSVSVSPTSTNYGAVPLSSNKVAPDTFTATNNGTMTENLNIKSSDATGITQTWTLVTGITPGSEQFSHAFSKALDFSDQAFMTTSYMNLVTNKAPNGTQSFKLKIWTPSSTMDIGQHTITVTVQAYAP